MLPKLTPFTRQKTAARLGASCRRRTAIITSFGSTRTIQRFFSSVTTAADPSRSTGAQTWSSDLNQPTGQFYHVAIDNQFPFHVFGASQDEGAYEGVSAEVGDGIGPDAWHSVALGESTFIAPDPDDVYVTYGSGYYSSLARLNRITGDEKNVSPWPRYMAGNPAIETKFRFGWTHPIFFSPANPHELLVAGQVVFSSTDKGQTWKIISPDLTRNDPSTEGTSGGPVYPDQTGAETFPDIASLAVSPLDANVLWAGSADGLVHVTIDHGQHWALVTPPQLPQWAQISSIEPSHTAKGTAYLTASRYMWDDYHPYLYETTDYGAHWTTLTNGLPSDQYLFVVRQDPREPSLLFAGTRSTIYISLDDGAQWEPLTLNLPGVQVRDLAIDNREGELVAATHGRAFWIMDNIALLEQLSRETTLSTAGLRLFSPETAWLSNAYGGPTFLRFRTTATIPNMAPPCSSTCRQVTAARRRHDLVSRCKRHDDANVYAPLNGKRTPKLTLTQEGGSTPISDECATELETASGAQPGMNHFQWDLKYAPAYDIAGFQSVPTDDWPDSADGPTVVPGAYTVVLQYDSQTV